MIIINKVFLSNLIGYTPLASLGVEPKWKSQEQGDNLDSRLALKDKPSGLNISTTFPPRCVKGGNTFWCRCRG